MEGDAGASVALLVILALGSDRRLTACRTPTSFRLLLLDLERRR